MNDKRRNHAAVSMGNKLFVIGGIITTSCEVFDSCSRKFINIKSEMKTKTISEHFVLVTILRFFTILKVLNR